MKNCCTKNDSEKHKVEIDNIDNIDNIDGLICYCFKKSKKELFEAVKNGKEELFVEVVKSKMKDPGCFCETSNPSGKCCLSDIQALIKAVKNSSTF